MIYKGFIGTYTKKESQGIYSFELDTNSKKIKNVKVAAKIESPTYLTITNNNQYLYAVAKEGDQGGIVAFKVDPELGELKEINRQLLPGANPCHVNTNNNAQLLFSTNYHKGTVDSYHINQDDGSVSPAISTIEHTGNGPDPRQEKAHVHFAGMTPDERYLAVVDLGSDLLVTYEVNDNGELKEVSTLKTPAGSGPRHLAFHPSKSTLAYLVTEFSGEVFVLSFDATNGSFTIIQTVRTIPEDFKENNQGSAIHISSDGKFLYTGNRGHNSIAAFRINDENGELTFIEHTSTEGNWPRDFVLDPSETFLIAANQESDNLTLFSRDPNTGKLSLIEKDIFAPEPVCLKFL